MSVAPIPPATGDALRKVASDMNSNASGDILHQDFKNLIDASISDGANAAKNGTSPLSNVQGYADAEYDATDSSNYSFQTASAEGNGYNAIKVDGGIPENNGFTNTAAAATTGLGYGGASVDAVVANTSLLINRIGTSPNDVSGIEENASNLRTQIDSVIKSSPQLTGDQKNNLMQLQLDLANTSKSYDASNANKTVSQLQNDNGALNSLA